MTVEQDKRQAAAAAVKMISNDMCVGLGSGSTACHFIELLAEECHHNLDNITTVATSGQSSEIATKLGLTVLAPEMAEVIDIAVDGADEIDVNLNLLKGGGGALVREKIIANLAREFVVIADYRKKVPQLGAFPLAVEIVRFAHTHTMALIRNKLTNAVSENIITSQPAASMKLRRDESNHPFVSENGNYIVDILCHEILSPTLLHDMLINLPGVVDTGIFINLADVIIIGSGSGVDIIR